jgi:tRNA uridine 5-carboxymethylaminomethyl modification enzyme
MIKLWIEFSVSFALANNNYSPDFDVIVIGAGHAGIEAALAAQRLGQKVLLATNNISRMGYMSCNPSIGGLAKGHMVKELDVLGGEMGVAADKTCIQFRRLNSSRGPAVRGSRAQCDKDLYCDYMAQKLTSTQDLTVKEIEVQSLIIDRGICTGVVGVGGVKITSRSVVVTTGTFMRAVMHFGLKQIPGGRVGDKATIGISDQLAEYGFTVGRLKTGTPARAHRDSINWEKLERQPGDSRFIPFSLRSAKQLTLPQIDCFVTWTTERTHEIIRKNLDKSPMFCGVIEGIGPRYCPSIEDKIHRFADKDKHQSFLEPEGLNTDSVYIQGMSTSLPEDVQYEFLKTMAGLENVKLLRPGYAVEYDFVEPNQLHHTLETKNIQNLFLAGQVNGTSGYEEAGAQGLMAGTNAALKNLDREAFILGRDEAYIGVLIDDLVTKGTREPYRMMTSRAEHRLVLREDNVVERLAHHAINLGLLNGEERKRYEEVLSERAKLKSEIHRIKIVPTAETQNKLRDLNTAVLQKPLSLADLLRRSEISSFQLREFGAAVPDDENVWEPVEIEIKYEGYIRRQNELIAQTSKLEKTRLPTDLNFADVYGLSREEVEKLSKARPLSVGQAQRISGVNPSAIQALLVHLRGREQRASK